MGHIAEKGLFGLFTLSGGFQRILQQLTLFQLPALLLIHFPEGQHRLALLQSFVKENAHVHPAVLRPKAAAEIASKLPDPLLHQFLDVGQRKTLHVLLIGGLLHNLSSHTDEILIPPMDRQALLSFLRSLDDLIGVPQYIHTIESVVGVAQDSHRLVGPLHPDTEPDLPPGEKTYTEQTEKIYEHKHCFRLLQIREDRVIRYRNDREPTVGHVAVIDASQFPCKVNNMGIISLQLPTPYPLLQPLDIGLKPLLLIGCGSLKVDQVALRVTKIKGGILRQVQHAGAELKVLQENIKGQYRIRVPALLRHCDDRRTVYCVGIDIGEDHIASGHHGPLVPDGVLHVVVLHTLPRVGRQDLTVQNRIGVHASLSQHILKALKIHRYPRLHLLLVRVLLKSPVDGLRAEGNERLIDSQVVPFFRRIGLCQRGPKLFRVFQQIYTQDMVAHHTDDHKCQQNQEIGPHIPEDPFPPSSGGLHPKFSRIAWFTRS